MKHFSNINKWQSIVEIDLEKNAWFEMHFCISFLSLLLMQTATENLWMMKSISRKLDPLTTHEKKFPTYEIPTRKRFRLTKYSREKISDPSNTLRKKFQTHEYPQEKFVAHKIPTRKKFRPTKYLQEKISDPQIPTRKISDPQNTHEKKILDPRNTHEGTMAGWY